MAQTRTNLATVNGNTVSIQFGNGSYFANPTNNPSAPVQSPNVGTYSGGTQSATANAVYADGGNTGHNALQIVADFANGSGNSNGGSIPVTLFFSKPVVNVSFTFFDVDLGNFGSPSAPYQDLINNIYGLSSANGAHVYPPTLTPTSATPSAAVTGAGTINAAITATANNAQNGANGNVLVSFDSTTPISQFTFTYGDVLTSGAHSTLQIIGVSNVNFTSVPEPGTLVWAGLGAVGAVVMARRRR